MKFRQIVVTAVMLLSVSIIALPAEAQTDPSPYRLVAYYASYSIYEDYYVTDIDASQLTHLIYGSVDISDNGQCVSSDVWTDTQYSYPGDKPNLRLRGNIRQLQLLRGNFPNLKILMSIGGWDHSKNFSMVAETPASRTRFVRSCVAFMREYLFDGIDLDWRYPVEGGQFDGLPEDTANYTLLVEEFRAQLDEANARDNRPYLLTMLVPPTRILYQNIEIDQVHTYLDWINLMSFGYQGEWSDLASHFAPLYANPRDPSSDEMRETYNVEGTVNAFLDAGVPADKLVVGIPFYAQAWRNVKPNDYFGLYQSASGVPVGTRPGGLLYYRDLKPLLENPAYTHFFDEDSQVPWLYSPDERIAVSYEDAQSVRAKVMFVHRQQLGGIMIWQINYDDTTDPLLDVAYEALFNTP